MAVPVISPTGPLIKKGKDVVHFSSDIDVVWSSDGGDLSSILARSVNLTIDNLTQTIYLRGTDGSDHTDVVITVNALIPNYWSWDTAFKATKDVLVFKSDEGSIQTDIKRGAK